MDIGKEEVKDKKEIGKLGKDKVWLVNTIGGLSMCVLGKPIPEILSMGSHPLMAKHIASKKFKDLTLDFAKSEELPIEVFQDLLPKYEALTDAIIALQKGK